MKRLLLPVLALCVGSIFTPSASYASPVTTSPAPVTLTLKSVGGANNGVDYIYPYNFSVNGSSALTSLMCVSFDREIFFNETWSATPQRITTSSSVLAQEDAYLFSQMGHGFSANDVQEAVWYLSASDPSKVLTTSNDAALLKAAAAAVALGTTQAFNNGQFSLYVANPGSQPAGDGVPQDFVGASVTPEPGSLVLLATGLLSSAGVIRRRRNSVV